jgi:hypothetical protein
MKDLMARILLPLVLVQLNFVCTVHPQAQTEIVGEVVRYDAISNAGTANADMIVRLKKNGQFMRLLYSPHGYSFDAPPPKTDELLPPEMFSNGRITWKFVVHPPSNSGQSVRCASFPKKGIRDGDGRLSLVDPYDEVPGTGSVIVPRADSLPCQIISSRSTIERVSLP